MNPTAPRIIINGYINETAANAFLPAKLETKNPSTTT
jgi:hypothetical protein